MSSKDIEKKTKTSLMDELKSIKGVLNTDDDNIPLLLDDKLLDDKQAASDDDIPVLANDDDIPVLTSPDDATVNKASLDAAIRQLESMELSPKSTKTRPEKTFDDKATTIRENPFIAKKPTDLFAESRKQAEEALKSVISHSRAMNQPAARPAAESKTTNAEPAPAAAPANATAVNATGEHAAADILKLLDDETPSTASSDKDFGEMVDIDAAVLASKSAVPAKKTDAQIDAVIDEVIEEYMVVLEAALRKKLKEKLPDLLKK